MEGFWVGKNTGVGLIVWASNPLSLLQPVAPRRLGRAPAASSGHRFRVRSADSYVPEQIVGKHDWTAYPNNRFPLTPNPGRRGQPPLTLLTLPSVQTPPPPLLLLRGGGGRWAGEISLGGIPVWVFLGVTWVAEERQWKSLSTPLNKEPVWPMAAFHITLNSASISSGSFFSFLV